MLLEAMGICKSYQSAGGRLDILKDVGLSIESAEVVSIVGPSGAGKSTLLHILGGLDKPDKGVVRIGSDDIYKLNDRKRADFRNARIGFVFQFYHLLPEFTALENVLLPVLIKQNNGNPKEFTQRGVAALGQVGLAQRATHKPSELSGGEQQRVAIARALINQPDIVFCDEPTGNLNTETGQQIIDLLMQLNRENGQTFVVVTHDENIAQRSGRTLHMRDGVLL